MGRVRTASWREPAAADPFAGADIPDRVTIVLTRSGRYYTGKIAFSNASEARFTRTQVDGQPPSTSVEWIYSPDVPQALALTIEMRHRPRLPASPD